MATAVHQSIDARLGAVLKSPVLAAFLNFLGGCILLIMIWQVKLFLRPSLIEEQHRRVNTPLYQRLGGLFGALFVVVGTFVIPLIGAAAFAVSSIFASQLTSFVIDFFDVGSLRRPKPHLAQLFVLALSLIGVVLSSYDGLSSGGLGGAFPLLIAIVSGVCLPTQTLLNVLYSVNRNKFQAELQSFSVACGILFVVGGILLAVGEPELGAVIEALETKAQWWMFTGGAFGAMLIMLSTHAMPIVGVAVLMLSLYAGIIAGSAILDFSGVFFPAKSITTLRVCGVCLTFVATIVYAVAQHKLARLPPPPPSSLVVTTATTPLLDETTNPHSAHLDANGRLHRARVVSLS